MTCPRSVQVSTFSFGEADTSFMSAIAEIGSGETYVIDSQDKIAEAFGLALAGLLTTIATEIKVTMTPVGGVSITELLHGGTEENGASGESPASCVLPPDLPLSLSACVQAWRSLVGRAMYVRYQFLCPFSTVHCW